MATVMTNLPIPTFYDPKNAGSWEYDPVQADLAKAAPVWAKKHGLKPASSDKTKVHLLLIDVQKDFCYPKGTLYVSGRSGQGAVDDSKKISEFIYRNLGRVTDITCTLDTHFRYQIFFPSFWQGKDGGPLGPFRFIESEEIKSGAVKPNAAAASFICNGNYGWLMKYVEHYAKSLEKAGKYKLYLWPYHCILGTTGHALVGVIEEARAFHCFTRQTASLCEVKGGNFLTENYSVLSPEVLVDQNQKPIAQRNVKFIKTLLESDAVVIAGQAASHCVKSSIDDLLDAINAQDPKLAKKVYILRDCMSAVVVPGGPDFTKDAEDALKKFEDAGMHVVDSTKPMDEWEGLAL